MRELLEGLATKLQALRDLVESDHDFTEGEIAENLDDAVTAIRAELAKQAPGVVHARGALDRVIGAWATIGSSERLREGGVVLGKTIDVYAQAVATAAVAEHRAVLAAVLDECHSENSYTRSICAIAEMVDRFLADAQKGSGNG